MPRYSRALSSSGCYHIIVRGVNRQAIVCDDQDRNKLINTLRRYSNESDVDILVYCLMDNHLHLLIKATDGASMFIKKVSSSYVYYFNHKYDRIGHLFQDRYKSEAVDTEEYLLTVARYILQNPRQAGICSMEEYPWSSWREMAAGDDLCDTQLLCDCIGDRQALLAFCAAPSDDKCMDFQEKRRVRDGDAPRLLQRLCGPHNPADIAALPKVERDAILAKAKAAGLTIRQISQLTGLDRNTIQRAQK